MPATNTDRNASLHDQSSTRAVLYQPDRTPRQFAFAFLNMDVKIVTLAQSTFSVTFPLYYIDQATGQRTAHPMASVTNTSTGDTALAEEWLNWTFDWWGRDQKRFSGPVVRVTITHKGRLASGFVTLECVSIETWGMGGRLIETADNDKWSKSATSWDDMVRDLLRTNMESGSITKPGDYPVSPTRSDFGPFTFTVEADTSTATAADHSVQAGKSLQDTVRELCTMPADENDWMDITSTETTAGTWRLGVVVGRPGTAREGIGTDLSGTVVVDGHRGQIQGAKREVDHLVLASVYKVGGKDKGASQGLTYVTDPTTSAKIGAREDTLTVPAADTAAERQNEARKAINDQKLDKHRRTEYTIQETPALRALVDFDVGDAVGFHDVVLGDTYTNTDQTFVRELHFSFVSPGPWKVKVGLGAPERNATRETGRSGGGGKGGGRRGGGPPKDSDGATDEDSLLIFRTVTGDSGTPAVADTKDDALAIVASTVNTPANVTTDAANDPEVLGIAVQYSCATAPTAPTIACYAEVLVDGAGGTRYVAIIEDGGAGDPIAPDAFKTFTPDSGGDVVAEVPEDVVTLAGGTAIATVGTPATDTVTFNFDGDTWGDIVTNSGTVGATGVGYDATLSIVGSGGITTSGSGTTVTIDGSGIGGGGNVFETVTADSGTDAVADSSTDTLTIAGGTAIATQGDGSLDKITVNFSGDTWGDITTDSGTAGVTGVGYAGGLSIVGGTSITTSASGTTVTITSDVAATFTKVNGDTGTATADVVGDTLNIVTGDSFITTAASDAPETVSITWCLPDVTCASGTQVAWARVCYEGDKSNYLVPIYICTAS